MNIRPVLTWFLVVSFCSVSLAQKIKYKELIVLLTAKQYEQAEPFLKKYLKDNDDNPNAYLFMGLIYQDKASRIDPLKNTESLITMIDSSVFYLAKANAGMTEKEISRNEEYYSLYSKRDLRTGKFGAKLSDVKLDIETRMKLKDKIPLLISLKAQFVASQKYFESARELFAKIQAAHPSNKELELRANDQSILQLDRLAQKYDSCHISFNDYLATSKAYGRTGYKQDLNPQEIKDFKKDGITEVDFYKDEVLIWDYKRWALSVLEIVDKEVKPMIDRMIAYDKEINTQQQKLKQDSVSIRTDLKALQATTFPYLQKIDPLALPLKVFDLKLSELAYGTQVVEDHGARDSTNMIRQAQVLRVELRLAKKIDSLGTALNERNIAEESADYESFVNAVYGTPDVLSSLIRTTKEFGARESKIKEGQLAGKMESLRWIIDGTDSVPLFREAPARSRFRPLTVKEEHYTTGIQYGKDSLASGYFLTITPMRKPEIKVSYPIDGHAFKRRDRNFIKSFTADDGKGQIYFILSFSEVKVKDRYPATLTKIYRIDGLAWSNNISFAHMPEEMIFSSEVSELQVKTRNPAGELFPVAFDKNGKEIKR